MAENKETNQEVQDNTPETQENVTDVQELSSKVKQSVTLPDELQEQVEKTERRTVKKLVEETIAGKFGSGRERMILLGDKYEAVQKEINLRIRKGEL
jgi:hypothetical protein